MRYHNITAIVAAEITLSFKLRPRLVQLPPRAFHLLSRTRNISSTVPRTLHSTKYRHTQLAQTEPSSEIPAVQDEARSNEPPAGSVVQKERHHLARQKDKYGRTLDQDKKAELRRTHFVELMRTVPHPVAVVTARKQDVADDVQGTVAATVSSFNTVSINPDLIVSFNIKSDSTTYKTILDSNHFTVTFPQMNAAGANLVHSFTQGNHPSPFTKKFPNHPTPLPSTWVDDEYIPDNLKYHPPAVSLTEPDSSESGFAFAMLCEYQTSTPVGDHVIVTGRLSPKAYMKTVKSWNRGRSRVLASHQVTLSYVQGTYSSSDTGPGFSNMMKLDDKALLETSNDKPEASLTGQITWCLNRLEIVAAAQMIRRGVEPAKIFKAQSEKDRVQLAIQSAELEPEILEEYERYYTQRLQYLEYQMQKLPKEDVSPASQKTEATPTPEETNPDAEEVVNVAYQDLLGHQQLFVRNKMLLSMQELDEEIALYSTRLSALRIKAKADSAAQALEEGNEHPEELAPEESMSTAGFPPEEEGLSRNMQLRRYFLGRIHLLEHAKYRKAGDSAANQRNVASDEELGAQRSMNRFLGVNRRESINGLRAKYRRYRYQATEAKLSLLGLEQLPFGHENIQILRDRIAYFEPRIKIIEDLIREKAKSASTTSLLIDSFPLPQMQRLSDSLPKAPQFKKKQQMQVDKTESVLARQLIRPVGTEIPVKEGDSADQLDIDHETLKNMTKTAVRRASNMFPVGKPVDDSIVPPSSQFRPQKLSAEEQAEQDLRQIQRIEKDLMRQNANQVRDYLVMQGAEDEEMPSPDDFVDVNKMREERLRKEKKEEGSVPSGTAS